MTAFLMVFCPSLVLFVYLFTCFLACTVVVVVVEGGGGVTFGTFLMIIHSIFWIILHSSS